MFSFIQLQADTITNAASNVVIEKLLQIPKFPLWDSFKRRCLAYPIGILLFYTFMSLLNAICISVKHQN
jgi:biopolymer transport protein ExbB